MRCLIRRWSHHILAYWDFPPHQVGIQIESSSRSSVLFFPSSKSLIRFCRNLERTFPSLGGWSLEPKPPKQPQVWCWPATTNARVESLISSCLQAKVEVEDQPSLFLWSYGFSSSPWGKSQKSWYGGPGLVLVLVVSHLSQSRQRRIFCLNIYRENSNWWGPIENGKYPSLVVVVGLKMEIFDIFWSVYANVMIRTSTCKYDANNVKSVVWRGMLGACVE